ncbi:AAA family ATPase [Streptosporangium longisporum]|uniref:AAA family ATPase n=1 Tax=Streptosporangium longisporum TaxID=46187 RepID=A0ABP6L4A2_9ACTN
MTTTTTAPGTTDPGDGSVTAARLRRICEEVSTRYLERANVIRPLVACMLAGQHSLLLGPPGTGKSEMARDITSRIEGARLWEILLSAYTDPKKMFGPIDVSALMSGVYQQVWDGRATQADIAFVDEIFKCGTGALNELLAFLNERVYHPEAGGDPIPCPLISAITASNELPTGEASAAVYDRLLVRMEVDYLSEPGNFAALLRSAVQAGAPTTPTTVPLADLQTAVRVHVPAVGVPDEVVDLIGELRASLRNAGLVASDRRWRQAIRLLQAAAWLDGRRTVTVTDLDLLKHVLWHSPAERPTVEREVAQVVNPSMAAALEILAGVEEIAVQLKGMAGKASEDVSEWAIREAQPKLRRADRDLQKLLQESQAAGRSTTTLQEVIDRRRAVHAHVMKEALGIDAADLNF